MTGIVAEAFALRRRCREEFELYLESQLEAADLVCKGRLLNRLGQDRGIDVRSLFLGSADRANLYASEELLEFWRDHRRRNYRQFEEMFVAALRFDPSELV